MAGFIRREATPFSQKELIIMAMARLADQGSSVIHAEDIIMAAWNDCPYIFSMRLYPEHPDGNKVLTNMMGKKGLVAAGIITRFPDGRYQLSVKGKAAAEILKETKNNPIVAQAHENGKHDSNPKEKSPVLNDTVIPEKSAASKKTLPLCDPTIKRLISSEAHLVYKRNSQELTFLHASKFWGILGNGKEIPDAIRITDDVLNSLEDKHDQNELNAIRNFHSFLKDRFDKHIRLIENRRLATR